jgi:hypothetical protein
MANIDDEQLRAVLDQLHQDLQDNPQLVLKERERLEHLVRDIEALLDEDDGDEKYNSVSNRLEAAIGEFEITHPSLTQTMTKLLGILSNVGF